MKLKVKLKLHNIKCDFRKEKHGNMFDLSANGTYTIPSPKLVQQSDIDYKIKLSSEIIYLGISTELPKWYRAEVKARSSLMQYFGCILVNGVGEIEADFGKQWFGHLMKLTDTCTLRTINLGDRILQMQISLRPDAPWYYKLRDLFVSGFNYKLVDVITATRGGHGHTGI